MATISEKNAETLIQEHLRERGWPLANFAVITKGFKDGLGGLEADYAILRDARPVAFIEAKRPGKDLWAALEQARGYARAYRESTGHAATFVFASDGTTYLRQNLKANTLPEKVTAFPTPAEFGELFQPQASVLHGQLRDYQRVAVSQVLVTELAEVAREYGPLDHQALLDRVYAEYPEFARKSVRGRQPLSGG